MVNKKLTEIFEEVDQIEVHSDNVCVNCGALLPDPYTTHCEICGYDLEEPFICPYKVSTEVKPKMTLTFCSLNRKQCQVKGLDYEVCSVFRSLDSIKND